MATAIATAATPAASIFPPPVTEIRLEIFDRIPARHFAQAVNDDSTAPLVRAGEVVVAEGDGSAGWYPVDGALFVAEYLAPSPYPDGCDKRTRAIVQTRQVRWGERDLWVAAPYVAARTQEEHARQMRCGGMMHCVDGPYEFDRLARKLIGRVVGIYCPAALGCAGRA